MTQKQLFQSSAKAAAYAAGAAAGAYAAYVGTAWLRYGHVRQAAADEADPLLDRFMPNYEVVERHHVHVRAPVEATFRALCEVDLERSPIVRAIFKGRELVLRADGQDRPLPRGLVAQTKALGWGMLAESPGHEIVMGAVTQPWKANTTFRALSPDTFLAFNEPDFVKIAWTLRADPLADDECMARSETRVMTTDPAAREKFRRYWSFFSPGIRLIRRVTLGLVKSDAEGRFRERKPETDRFVLASAGDLDPQC